MKRIRSIPTGVLAIFAAFAAIVLQTLVRVTDQRLLPTYLALFATYLIFYGIVLARQETHLSVLHLYLIAQSVITLALLALDPGSDVINGLFALLAYQVAMRFSGKVCWIWLAILVFLITGSLVFFLGALRGLALGMTPTAATIALALLVIANQDVEAARSESQALVDDLREKQRQLQMYTKNIQELAILEERNRLARELHDSISQTMFSISLTLRSAQMLLERRPQEARDQLRNLQRMANDALAEMRNLVIKLRPQRS